MHCRFRMPSIQTCLQSTPTAFHGDASQLIAFSMFIRCVQYLHRFCYFLHMYYLDVYCGSLAVELCRGWSLVKLQFAAFFFRHTHISHGEIKVPLIHLVTFRQVG